MLESAKEICLNMLMSSYPVCVYEIPETVSRSGTMGWYSKSHQVGSIQTGI